jgi:predicted aspartyl protease
MILSCSLFCFGQKSKQKQNFGFYFTGKYQKEAKIPFEIYANLIVLKVSIDEQDTLNFILDTGVSSFIITDPSLSKNLDLKNTRKVKIKGAGNLEYINADVSINHKVRIGKFVVQDKTSLVILSEDILKLSEYMGIPISGIFGHDLFSQFVVHINFANKTIYLFDPSRYNERRTKGTKFPLTVTQTKPYIESSSLISDNDGKSKPLRLVIDTGAGHALMLNQDDNIVLPDKTIKANLGRGLNGSIDGHIGRIFKFKIGDFEFKNVLASFPDSLSFGAKFDLNDKQKRQGSIGGELLRRFVITFNYEKGYLALKPLKAKYRETFEHDMSGMEVRAKGDFFDEYIVSYVKSGSQADLAGVEIGDQIIFINNKNYKDMSISDIYAMLSKKEGKEIELFIRRGSELKFIYFKLKRLI